LKITGYGHVQIAHATDGTNRLFITEGGNMGVGTSESVTSKLTVKSNWVDENSGFMIDSSDGINSYWMKLYPYIVGASRVGYKFKTHSSIGENIPLTLLDDGNVSFGGNANASTFNSSSFIMAGSQFITAGYQTEGGMIFTGDGTTSAHWKVSIGGSFRLSFYRDSTSWTNMAYIDSNGNWVGLSDIRAKDDILDLDSSNSLQKILSLNAKHYVMKNSPFDKTKKCIGFIAQEVEVVIPACVSTHTEEKVDENDLKHLNYNDIFVHNVNSTKALYGFIQQQQIEINALKSDIASLKEIVRLQNDTLTQVIDLLNALKK
jgi:hypothetical protein